MEATILLHDNGHYSFEEGHVDINSVKDRQTVREMRYVEIDEDTHRHVLSILDNPLLLPANLRPLFVNARP